MAGKPSEWSVSSFVEAFIAASVDGQWTCHTEHPWIHVIPAGEQLPDQGWKLHIAGTVLSARDILTRALPVLLDARVQFKLAGDLDVLEWACSPSAPRVSAGKFITVYPRDSTACGIIAERLDTAFAGIDGPVILSDLPYRPGSLVSCRYGAFGARYVRGEGGAIRLALLAPDGSLREDRRQPWFEAPSWAPPPPDGFSVQDVAAETPAATDDGAGTAAEPADTPTAVSAVARPVLLGGRFMVTEALRFTARGGIYQATDIKSDQQVVVKQARPHIGVARDGLDSRSFLLNEWSMLHLLVDTGLTPAPVALFREGGDLFIAEEFLTGTRMDRWGRQYRPGPAGPGDRSRLLTVLTGMCDAVAEFHARDLVIRDLTPDNVFIDGLRVRLCDVENVAFRGTVPRVIGTAGFTPPEQRDGRAAMPEADLYALGALLYTVCTGFPPLLADDDDTGSPPANGARDDRSSGARIAALLARCAGSWDLLDAMSGVIVALLADNPRERMPLGEVSQTLRTVLSPSAARIGECGSGAAKGPGDTAARAVTKTAAPAATDSGRSLVQARELIKDIAGHLVSTWNPALAEPWPFVALGLAERPLDVYAGVAGGIGVLTQPGISGYCSPGPVVRAAARWLAGRHQPDETDRPGLHVGNCGIAWALGLAAAKFAQDDQADGGGDGGLTTELMSRLRTARSLPASGDDLLYGTAGMVVAHAGVLEAADTFGLTSADHAEIKDRLAMMARHLSARLTPTGTRQEGTLAGSAWLGARDYGFAHGTAGVGYALLTAGAVLGEDRLIGHAASIADTIMAARVGPGDQAWWPMETTTATPIDGHWCAGSSGIATFLLRFWWHTGSTAAFDTAVAASRATIASRVGAPACMCHGLAGDGDLFLDLAAATGDDSYVQVAWSLAGQLWDLRTRRDGRWLLASQTGDAIGIDYGMGMSGVLAFLLRLVHGGTRLWMPGNGSNSGFPAFRPRGHGHAGRGAMTP